MSQSQAIDIVLTPTASGRSTIPDDPWWLRIEQIENDDRATTGDVAELVDKLYDLDPCVDVEEIGDQEPEDDPTEEDLLNAAGETFGPDLVQCQRRLMGDYTAQFKVIRSHQSEGYRLIYGIEAGPVVELSRVVTNEEIDITIDIDGGSSVTLDYPVAAALQVSWQGSVRDGDGVVPPPVIKRRGNTLFWDGSITGSLRAAYQTVYDLITIDVPGKPTYEGATTGDSQDVNILAFYHRLVFIATISPPPVDDSADQATIAELCGWSQTDNPDDDDEEPIEPPPVEPEYGCLEPPGDLADPEYYLQKCCTLPPFALPDCARWTTARLTESLPESVRRRYAEQYNNVEFIGVGPGPQGCGKIYNSWTVPQLSCCEDVPPLVPSPDNPETISPGEGIYLEVFGGRPATAYRWIASGGLVFVNGLNWIDAGNVVHVFAPDDLCLNNLVRVDDGCSRASMPLVATGIEPLTIDWYDRLVAPGGGIYVMVSGGSGPFLWAGSPFEISGAQGGRGMYFTAPDDFCGVGEISVSDSCGAVASCRVRSTLGAWVNIGEYGDIYCQLPMGGTVSDEGLLIADGYMAGVFITYDYGCAGGGDCPPGNSIATGPATPSPSGYCYCNEIPEQCLGHYYFEKKYVSGCCSERPGGQVPPAEWSEIGTVYQIATNLREWRCHA